MTEDEKPVKFSYSESEFPGFSWRGYATLSASQVNHVTVWGGYGDDTGGVAKVWGRVFPRGVGESFFMLANKVI